MRSNYSRNKVILTNGIFVVNYTQPLSSSTVSHEKLQLKLQACGISGQLLLLISNFLHDRSQVTKVGRHISQGISLTSGVV